MANSPARLWDAPFTVGIVEVLPRRNLLRRSGDDIHVEPRVMDVLCALASRAGEVLTREALIDRVWQVEYGADESLTRAISQLRKAFRQADPSRNYIETVPKRGYRLSAPVAPPESLDKAAALAAQPTPAPAAAAARAAPPRRGRLGPAVGLLAVIAAVALGIVYFSGDLFAPGADVAGNGERAAAPATHSIAVLPFADLSADADQSYLADGVAEEITSALVSIPDLKVIGRTSAASLKARDVPPEEIGDILGVGHVLDGSVQRQGDRLRINAQLIQTGQGFQVWSQSYERELVDIFALQDEIARAVGRALEIMLIQPAAGASEPVRKVDPETYELYLRGMASVREHTQEGFEAGVALLERAAERSPDEALPFTGLALAYSDLAHLPDPPQGGITKARRYALQALDRDDGQAAAHLVLAEIQLYSDYDIVAAKRSFERALALDRSSARGHAHYAWLLNAIDRNDEAEAEFFAAIELAPLNPLWPAWLGWFYHFESENDKALAAALDSLAIAEDFPVGLYVVGAVYAEQGRIEEAIAVHERLNRLYRGEWEWALGETYAIAGREADAREIIARNDGANAADAWTRFAVYCELHDAEGAFEALRDMVRYRHSFVPWARKKPACGQFRDHELVSFIMAPVKFEE